MGAAPGVMWRAIAEQSQSERLPKGLDAVYHVGTGLLARLLPRQRSFVRRAGRVLALEKSLSEESDARLRENCEELRARLLKGRAVRNDLERASGLVREVAFRQVGQRPFAVQVAGAMAIQAGCIAEMMTGEGKTLTATMPATIAGWRGRGCHVITVNDYLARRDAEWMGSIYRFCGLTVAHIEQGMSPRDRRRAYQADITYCTNKEVTADFLRDQLVLGRMRNLPSALLSKIVSGVDITDRLVLRGLEYAIVDEVDSVLIDEAVTPLIISGEAPNPEQIQAFEQAAALAARLEASDDYEVDRRYREIHLTASGKKRIAESAASLGGLWRGTRRSEELVVQALVAREHFAVGKHYVIDDGKVVIVDEFTGRLMPDRTWREGLHQVIEAKEALPVTPVKDTYARISFQRFFRLYRTLSGMTGTASEAASELWRTYSLPVVVIPTNRPCIRIHMPHRVFTTASAKWRAVVAEIRRVNESGRPILVGTRSVWASEHLSKLLAAEGLEHQVLNAVRHAEEAQIVACAGQMGKITVATNMAGRGTDIVLGRGVAELGGLHVLATERHEAGRIDRQLFGRAGRQGDPGSAQAFVSLEDELVSRQAPHFAAVLRRRYINTDRDVSGAATLRLFEGAQRRAERLACRQRQAVLRTDDWLDESLGFAGAGG